MKFKKSKFVLRISDMTVTEGKLPTREGSLWKGETDTGDKIECAGGSGAGPVFYHGWSSG